MIFKNVLILFFFFSVNLMSCEENGPNNTDIVQNIDTSSDTSHGTDTVIEYENIGETILPVVVFLVPEKINKNAQLVIAPTIILGTYETKDYYWSINDVPLDSTFKLTPLTYVFVEEGIYTISLYVTDIKNNKSIEVSYEIEVISMIVPSIPNAIISVDTYKTNAFTANRKSNGKHHVKYRWFQNGIEVISSEISRPFYNFDISGNPPSSSTVSLIVSDTDGRDSVMSTINFVISPFIDSASDPKIEIFDRISGLNTVIIDSISTNLVNPIFMHDWILDGYHMGSNYDKAQFYYTFARPGQHKIELNVMLQDGSELRAVNESVILIHSPFEQTEPYSLIFHRDEIIRNKEIEFESLSKIRVNVGPGNYDNLFINKFEWFVDNIALVGEENDTYNMKTTFTTKGPHSVSLRVTTVDGTISIKNHYDIYLY
ncbi:MAG: hypothetical protein HRU38_00275 [Saccharospirillaceae bacterium]|nr:hypothetical protein [Saccharospirillaceae bacterium]